METGTPSGTELPGGGRFVWKTQTVIFRKYADRGKRCLTAGFICDRIIAVRRQLAARFPGVSPAESIMCITMFLCVVVSLDKDIFLFRR